MLPFRIVLGTAVAASAALVAASVTASPGAASPDPSPGSQRHHGDRGSLVLIGGALREDAEILRRIVELADPDGTGPDRARIAVVTAAASPARTAEEAADADLNNAAANGLYYSALFERFGADTYAVPVDTTQDAFTGDAYGPDNADNRAVADAVRTSTGVFFGGGDQTDYVRTLMRCRPAIDEAYRSCRDTRVLGAVASVLRADGVVAGVSAGTTIQQGADMVTGGESYEAWRDGAAPGYFDDTTTLGYLPHGGFGFFRQGLLDSHFGTWGRQARMVRLARDTGHGQVVGVDETTALVVDRASSTGEVIGRNGVSVMRIEPETTSWSYLTRGDRVDLVEGTVTRAADARAVARQGDGPAERADIWDSVAADDPGVYSLVDQALALVTSTATTATGTTLETDPRFVTTLIAGPGTSSWETGAGLSFAHLDLTIAPE
ncbi:MAG TPA: cyanophycinase [Nocardioides sp.]|nr:cyanophycinase [Nocardioides sp.]